jgi:hypothetical protein
MADAEAEARLGLTALQIDQSSSLHMDGTKGIRSSQPEGPHSSCPPPGRREVCRQTRQRRREAPDNRDFARDRGEAGAPITLARIASRCARIRRTPVPCVGTPEEGAGIAEVEGDVFRIDAPRLSVTLGFGSHGPVRRQATRARPGRGRCLLEPRGRRRG